MIFEDEYKSPAFQHSISKKANCKK